MFILFCILGYFGCGIITLFICPLLIWFVENYQEHTDATYKDKWSFAYKDDLDDGVLPVFIIWPLFLIVILGMCLFETPKMIKYACGTKKRYIASIEEQAAKIMRE